MEPEDQPLDIHVSELEDYLLVAASGHYSLDHANDLFKQAIDNGVRYKKRRILIDVALVSGSIPLMDRFYFSEFLASYRITHASGIVDSIAVFGLAGTIHQEKFGETVAVNRGTNVRVFTDYTAAVDWLVSQ
ncbi:MAG: hypothetical protein JWQ27_2723 [Ferruginibacter sp.]|nr:hypothetical protein [Ferruginibacter sp.]